jgi:hypothetical protein
MIFDLTPVSETAHSVTLSWEDTVASIASITAELTTLQSALATAKVATDLAFTNANQSIVQILSDVSSLTAAPATISSALSATAGVKVSATVVHLTGPVESSSGTIVTYGKTITDSNGTVWGLTAGVQITKNGAIDSVTAKVTELAYVNHVIWQCSTNGNAISTPGWWYWNGTAWIAGADPITKENLSTTDTVLAWLGNSAP